MKGLCKTAIIFQKMKGKSGWVKDSTTSSQKLSKVDFGSNSKSDMIMSKKIGIL
jgi:hypothetical protein